jgi:hypothetical protein
MRKMIWCGTALLVFGVAAVFFAARYAAMNPDSLLGRCAHAAYFVGVRCNPLVYMNRPAKEQVAAGKVVPGAGLPIPAAVVPGDEHQEAPVAERPDVPDVVESIVVDDGEEHEAAPVPADETPEPVRLQDSNDKDMDKLPISMPYADENDDEVGDLGDRAGCAGMPEFLKGLMQDNSTKSCPSCTQCVVQSIVDLVKELLGDEPAEQVEVPAAPVQVAPEAGQQNGEEAQEVRPEPKSGSGFREDPYYHHQYPGCPYTGQCPYPHHYNLPPVTPPAAPSKKGEKSSPHSHLILDEWHTVQWTQLQSAEAGIKNLMAGVNAVHPEVDTMECRPTDLPDMDVDETF